MSKGLNCTTTWMASGFALGQSSELIDIAKDRKRIDNILAAVPDVMKVPISERAMIELDVPTLFAYENRIKGGVHWVRMVQALP